MKYKHPFKSPSAWVGLEHKLDDFLGPATITFVRNIVEVGVDKGYSLCHFALRYSEAKVIGVDNFSYDDGPAAKEMLERVIPAEFPNVELWHLESKDASIKYKYEVYNGGNKPIDILHIDAGHLYHEVKRDFELWEPLVRSGGVVLFHDIQSFPNDVGKFFDELEGKKKSIQEHCGFGAWYKD